MSNTRRKLLLTETGITGSWTEIARFTTVETNAIKQLDLTGYSELGFFIVGGGGSGHGDFNNAATSGCGGNGGCVNYWTIPVNGNEMTITVGAGGAEAGSRSNSHDGSASSVTYNGTTYTSNGGYGGCNSPDSGGQELNTKQANSGVGGRWQYGDITWDQEFCQAIREFALSHTILETTTINGATIYGSKGEDGLANPFDPTDTNLYGAGGGGAFDAYALPFKLSSPVLGGTTGGGTGGYGQNNAETNKGQNATFYGGGGGGGSFSSTHTYGQGGEGYQGIIIIYAK